MKFKVFVLSVLTLAFLSTGLADEVASLSGPAASNTAVDDKQVEPDAPRVCTSDSCPIGLGKVITVTGGGGG